MIGSPCHVARTLRAQTRIPIHRYLNALYMILDGATDLTRVALDRGFYGHSHFTAALRREFRMPPSAFRQQPEMSLKN